MASRKNDYPRTPEEKIIFCIVGACVFTLGGAFLLNSIIEEKNWTALILLCGWGFSIFQDLKILLLKSIKELKGVEK